MEMARWEIAGRATANRRGQMALAFTGQLIERVSRPTTPSPKPGAALLGLT